MWIMMGTSLPLQRGGARTQASLVLQEHADEADNGVHQHFASQRLQPRGDDGSNVISEAGDEAPHLLVKVGRPAHSLVHVQDTE